ncbi:hypothetical protein M1I50_09615 [Clostridioides difficile]|uniref:hypothetical protein n=1 Tax=Clostridioides difficile TaxID=1496 RepID=UPI000D1F0CF6|nr:hypothetical protein [Clostridioides difficile]MBZ4494442.1 hypothetical protein [Clostridioides difficile]MCL0943240.1 hypothetical protein [Clostridioides difficile]MCM4101014.1 hypothetical protein [Clostridioides difficile]MDI2845759.1 hypothetical protein [Clostridioides difficile]HBG2116841.1 hypothetical protein [Clostridioides difficile]
MNEKILELLQKIDNRLNGIENEIKEVKTDMNTRFDSIEKKQDILYNQSISTAEEMTSIKDNFDVVDIKLNAIETRVITINRKLNGTTDQVARNMEQLEEIKIKLQ